MKILFITDNFPPEVNAPATRTFEHCREWVIQGLDVTIITCFPNFPQGKLYSGYKSKLYQKENIDGIKVIRVWSYITANEGFLKRTLDYFSFALMATLIGLFIKTDKIVATSPQFFAAAAGRWLSFLKRKQWIMEVRDLWPESIKNVDAMNSGLGLRFLEWWEYRLYKTASKIVVVTDAFKTFIINRGIGREKIFVVKNGANMDLYRPAPKNEALLMKLNLQNKFIISYIGTHGLAHKLDFILTTASHINNPDFHFLFIGAGAEKSKLIKLKDELGLTNVTMLDPIKKDEVPDYIGLSNVSLIPLKKSVLFHTVIPSKIFETSAMQIPILLGVEGESKAIIEKYQAGLCFEPENENDFIEKLNLLYTEKDLYTICKVGCARLATDFDRKVLAKKMLSVITN
ncbi:MAG TPA: glycosyltransferase family 4 protein [Bacteroidales bacterium]|nr:glycosyltransferase family 4 protein [Bacteroidales bacterium]